MNFFFSFFTIQLMYIAIQSNVIVLQLSDACLNYGVNILRDKYTTG